MSIRSMGRIGGPGVALGVYLAEAWSTLHALEYSGYQTRPLDLQRQGEGREVAEWIEGKIVARS